MVRVIWSPQGIADFDDVVAEMDVRSPPAARLFAARVRSAVAFLATSPRFGAEVGRYRDPDVRELLFGNYRLIYRVRPTEVEIGTF